jgi:chromate transporter
LAFPSLTTSETPRVIDPAPAASPTLPHIAALGAKAGLLSFGGAYTAVPIVEKEALRRPTIDAGNGIEPARGWITRDQLLDSLAISGILPAPFIIFTTFVGYLGAGLPGALVITVCVFLPAFAFTLIGHTHLERLVDNKGAHTTLDAITAGVVGIIAVTAISITVSAIELHRFRGYPPLFDASIPRTVILIAALIALFTIKWRHLTPILILASALTGTALL